MSSARWWCGCLILWAALVVGCNDQAFDAPDDRSTSTSSSVERVEGSASTSIGEHETRILTLEEVPAVFRDLAAYMTGIPVFCVAELPDEVLVADYWWPIVEGDPESVDRQSAKNPRVVGEGGPEPEGQVLLRSGAGWLAVLENFRGDLGEVSGELVGTISGQNAYLYEVSGGWLVQWAFEGRWYGVFGRDVDPETVTTLALEMGLVEAD